MSSFKSLNDVDVSNKRVLIRVDLNVPMENGRVTDLTRIERVAPTNSRVLLVGPSGAGKELAARTLHQLSGRINGPFVVINAAAITPERMETELFGVDQSNGSEGRKAGGLEEAHGGTLFIDDIADLPRETQNKILRVLVDQTFQRVGGSTKIAVDVRIVSSTARNLEALIVEGKFREDLYQRLNVFRLEVPPLRERPEDIALQADHFLRKNQREGLPTVTEFEVEITVKVSVTTTGAAGAAGGGGAGGASGGGADAAVTG